jgi:hypothetical protein
LVLSPKIIRPLQRSKFPGVHHLSNRSTPSSNLPMAGIKRKQILETPGTTPPKKVRVEINKSSKSVSKPQSSKKPLRARQQLRTKPVKSDIAGDENSFEGFSDNQEDEHFERDASFSDAVSNDESAPTVKGRGNPRSRAGNKTTSKLSNRMFLFDHFTSSVLTQTQNRPGRRTQNRKPLPKSAKP